MSDTNKDAAEVPSDVEPHAKCLSRNTFSWMSQL